MSYAICSGSSPAFRQPAELHATMSTPRHLAGASPPDHVHRLAADHVCLRLAAWSRSTAMVIPRLSSSFLENSTRLRVAVRHAVHSTCTQGTSFTYRVIPNTLGATGHQNLAL